MKKTSFRIIGVMAGSSMDGLDLAEVSFELKNDRWGYLIHKTETIEYPTKLLERLKISSAENQASQQKLDKEFGKWISEQINGFNESEIDLVAVHGHTVIHKPQNQISWQLGDGKIIANECNVPCITEFRTLDVQLGGQGAPLVPFGDFNLFSAYSACLNLGGIANISIRESGTAWDICPCNQILNYLAGQKGLLYDMDGELARKGSLMEELFNKIQKDHFFEQHPPKSLPNNYLSTDLFENINIEDGLHTYCHFVAQQIKKDLLNVNPGKMLISGGGAHNSFLIQLIRRQLSEWKIEVPNEQLISFKESLVFAFLGLMKFRGEINVLSSVTGAAKDTSSGVIHFPK